MYQSTFRIVEAKGFRFVSLASKLGPARPPDALVHRLASQLKPPVRA